MVRKLSAAILISAISLGGCSTSPINSVSTNPATPVTNVVPIQHVVVIFGENISFDHYFGTYPNAANLSGETAFKAVAGTPTPNNFVKTASLLTANPNLNKANGNGASNPHRLSPAQAVTADQDHNYADEQAAYNNGNMDLFPASVGKADTAALATATGAAAISSSTGLTMGYYDGNTVTGLWNYAQHYAMSDNSYSTVFGPSTPGAINLVSGQTNGVINSVNPGNNVVADGNGGVTMIGDLDPTGDLCSATSGTGSMSGKNVGDLLNSKAVTWGWFQGGFDLTMTNGNGSTGCKRSTVSPQTGIQTGTQVDYVPHHQPFQFYSSTANLQHLRPTSVAAIGKTDQANHQYDIHDFSDALAAGNMPAVSFLKAPKYQNGHAGNSDPIDEQTFVVNTINAIEQSKFWSSTAVIVAYDDSDGWYDHASAIINGSATTFDKVNGSGVCISSTAAKTALAGADGKPAAQGRCGYGTRQPLLIISPWARKNYIDSTVTDQSSILRFIEDIFITGTRVGNGSFDSIAGTLNGMFDFGNGVDPTNGSVVILDPSKGTVTSGN